MKNRWATKSLRTPLIKADLHEQNQVYKGRFEAATAQFV